MILSEELRVGGNGNEENGERAKKKKGKVGEAPPSVLAVFYYPFTVLMLKFSLHLSLPPPPLGSHLTIPPSFQFPFSPNFLFLKFYSKVKKKKKINISFSILTGFQFFTAPSLSSSWVYSVFNKLFLKKKQ